MSIDPAETILFNEAGTFGPWDSIVGNQGRGALVHVETAIDAEIAGITICSINKRAQDGRGEANAFLIAHNRQAAPEHAAEVLRLREEVKRLSTERDDYRNLFRDACGSIAHIATAAGFSPTDENVEPPDVAARVENMRRALSKAAKERDEALQRLADARAPVGEVNVEEVLRLDREGTPAERWTADIMEIREGDRYVRYLGLNSYTEITEEYDFDDPARAAEHEAALASIKTDEALFTLCRTAAPKLAREVIRLRELVRFVDEQGAEAIDRISREIVADKWNATGEFQRRALVAEAEAEELRLTLAAEQGKPEGAPSPRWTWRGDHWQVGPDTDVLARAWPGGRLYLSDPKRICGTLTEHGTARAAMIAADAAQTP